MTNPVWKNPDAVTMPQLLREAARKWPDKTYLDFSGETYSFAEIDRRSNRLAHGLAALGVMQGSTVCSFLDSGVDALLVWFAVVKLGAVIVPINTAFKGEFLRHQISDARARVIIMESHYVDRLIGIEESLPEMKTLVTRGEPTVVETRLARGSFESLFTNDETHPAVEIKPGDLATLLYTSGTTGPSKGCMVSHNYGVIGGAEMFSTQKIGHDDVVWIALPLFHLAAISMVMGCLFDGATLAITKRFSVSGFWPEIERCGATAMFGLASMFPMIADAPETEAERRCYGQLRCVFGAPFLREMQDRWKERFGVRQTAPAGYGMTECAPICSYPGHEVPPAATGKPVPWIEVRIVDDEGIEVPPGVPGEIVIRPKIPYVMFDGYWQRPQATADATHGLWFHCGDIGKIDAEGYFYFVDRKKDYLRYRGENISSYELEMAFRAHPEVADVAIHAVLSAFSEDEVKATVVRHEGASLSEHDLCLWSIERLPYFCVPRFIEFRPELPRNAVGRVLKYELRKEGVTAATWDREAAGIKVKR